MHNHSTANDTRNPEPTQNTEPAANDVHWSDREIFITCFEGNERNCFPASEHFCCTWNTLPDLYRDLAALGHGKPKAGIGYGIFATLKPGTPETIAAIKSTRVCIVPGQPTTEASARIAERGYRNGDHVVCVTAIAIDYDELPKQPPNWSPDAWPCAVFGHSSHNWATEYSEWTVTDAEGKELVKCEGPGKWRAILPLLEPLPYAEYKRVRDALASLLPPGAIVRDTTQPAFFPTCPAEREVQFASVEGEPLNWRKLLADAPAPRSAQASAGPLPSLSSLDAGLADKLVTALVADWPHVGKRHDASLALGGTLRRAGVAREDAEAIAAAVMQGVGSTDAPARVKAALDAWERADVGGEARGRTKLLAYLRDGGPNVQAALAEIENIERDRRDRAREAEADELRAAVADGARAEAEAQLVRAPITTEALKQQQRQLARHVDGSSGLLLSRFLDGKLEPSAALPVAKLLAARFSTLHHESIADCVAERLPGAERASVVDAVRAARAPARGRQAASALPRAGRLERISELLKEEHELAWNEMALRVEIDGLPWKDDDTTRLRMRFEALGHSSPDKPVPASDIEAVACRLAQAKAYHPVREYLRGLTWDGSPRLDALFPRYFGADDTQLNRALGACFGIGAVKRALQPGTKVDLLPILLGAQGTFKSSGLRALAGAAFFTDARFNPQHRAENAMSLNKCWVWEIAELEGMNKAEQADIKAFISRADDDVLLPYARTKVALQRMAIMIGTTNEQHCLKDPTGSRRNPVIAVGRIDVAAIRRDRDQLWAEAVHRAARDEQHWLTPELEAQAAASNEQYQDVNESLQSAIMSWLAKQPTARGVATGLPSGCFTVADALTGCNIMLLAQTRPLQVQAGTVLRRLGYAGTRRTVHGVKLTVYTFKDNAAAASAAVLSN